MSIKEWIKAKLGKDPDWEPTFLVKNPTVGSVFRLYPRRGGAGYTRKPRRPYGTQARMKAEKKEKRRRKIAKASRRKNRD
jgi:hypothetical protein